MRTQCLIAVWLILLGGCGGAPTTTENVVTDLSPSASASPDSRAPTSTTSDRAIVSLEDIVLEQLDTVRAAVRDDGSGSVTSDQAVGDLASFTAERSDVVAARLAEADLVEAYFRLWTIGAEDLQTAMSIEMYMFRDARAAAGAMSWIAESLETTNAVERADIWQELLTGDAADLALMTRPLDGVPESAVLNIEVVDALNIDARGVTYELIAFRHGPALATLWFFNPPGHDSEQAQDRASRIAAAQYDRMVDTIGVADA